jgi:hypothetical protein
MTIDAMTADAIATAGRQTVKGKQPVPAFQFTWTPKSCDQFPG